MAAATKASAMPVLPEVGSTRVERPGAMRPSRSAASTIARPMRSFTEPSGLKISSLMARSAARFSAAAAAAGGRAAWSRRCRARCRRCGHALAAALPRAGRVPGGGHGEAGGRYPTCDCNITVPSRRSGAERGKMKRDRGKNHQGWRKPFRVASFRPRERQSHARDAAGPNSARADREPALDRRHRRIRRCREIRRADDPLCGPPWFPGRLLPINPMRDDCAGAGLPEHRRRHRDRSTSPSWRCRPPHCCRKSRPAPRPASAPASSSPASWPIRERGGGAGRRGGGGGAGDGMRPDRTELHRPVHRHPCADAVLLPRAGSRAAAAGPVGLVSQCGALMGALFVRAPSRGGFSRCVSVGNQADLELCDFFDYLIADPATRVDQPLCRGPSRMPPASARCCAGAGLGKPVLCIKAGRTEAGAQAARTTPRAWPASVPPSPRSAADPASCWWTSRRHDHGGRRAGLALAGGMGPGGIGLVVSSGGGGAVTADRILAGPGLPLAAHGPTQRARELDTLDFLRTHHEHLRSILGSFHVNTAGCAPGCLHVFKDARYRARSLEPMTNVAAFLDGMTPQPLMPQTIEAIIAVWRAARKPLALRARHLALSARMWYASDLRDCRHAVRRPASTTRCAVLDLLEREAADRRRA